MASVTTITSSHKPLLERVPAPITAFSLIIVEYVTPHFQIEECNETQTNKLKDYLGKIRTWPKPTGKRNQLVRDFISARDEVIGYLSKERSYIDADVKIITAWNGKDLQAILIYTRFMDYWRIRHLVARRICDKENPAKGAGTAVMHCLIDSALNLPNKVRHLELTPLLTSKPFYETFGFKYLPDISMVKSL